MNRSTLRRIGRASRSRRSVGGNFVEDTAYIFNHVPWQWVVVVGMLGFALFFWAVPALLAAKAEAIQNTKVREAVWYLVELNGRRSQWVAIAIALVCSILAVRNRWISRQLGP